jgi:hypothetical protein
LYYKAEKEAKRKSIKGKKKKGTVRLLYYKGEKERQKKEHQRKKKKKRNKVAPFPLPFTPYLVLSFSLSFSSSPFPPLLYSSLRIGTFNTRSSNRGLRTYWVFTFSHP